VTSIEGQAQDLEAKTVAIADVSTVALWHPAGRNVEEVVAWRRRVDRVESLGYVEERRAILEAALGRGMGDTTYADVRREFERRIEAGEFREVSHLGAGRQYTTTAMVHMEREIIGRVQEGNRRDYSDPLLVSPQVRIATEDRHPELNASQRQAVDEIFVTREKVVGSDGIAGAGKTTTLSVIREGVEAEGYRVEGFAPTSRAAQKLGEAGFAKADSEAETGVAMPHSSESSRKSILLVIALVCALPLIAEKPQETHRPKYDLSTESKMKATVQEVKLPAKGSEKEIAHLLVKIGTDIFDVYLCPKAFLDDMGTLLALWR